MSAPEPTWARRALRLGLALALFTAFGALGRATVLEHGGMSLVWPAAGIAALWIGTGDPRALPLDLAALALSTYAVNTLSGISPGIGILLVATNLIQVCAFVMLVRSQVPGLWGFGGTEPLTRLGELGRITGAALLSSLVASGLGTLGVWLLHGTLHLAAFPVWWGRNSIALVVMTIFGVMICQPLAAAGSARQGMRRLRGALAPGSVARVVEVIALIATSVTLYLVLFLEPGAKPLAFLVLSMSVWTGLRFPPLAVTLHGFALGVAGLVFTLAGKGPFMDIAEPHYRAVVAQVFIAMTVLTGLALAFGRTDRDAVNRELVAARRAADERAQLFGAVLETMQEGMVVIEEGGTVLVRNEAAIRLMGLQVVRDRIRPAESYRLYHANGEPVTEEDMPGNRALQGIEVPPEDLQLRSPAVPEGRVLEIAALPLPQDDPDAPHRALVNIRDVTVDRQHRDTLLNFAGVVAHDLFNPLSLVNGWAETLEDAFSDGPVIPAVGLPMVARIHEAAQHMRHFIGDLMNYTVARDQSLHVGPVDLSATARGLAALRGAGSGGPVIVVQDGLYAWADAGLVRQLLDNLLGNAVKYVPPGVRPVIEVSGENRGDWLQVRVSDNGIGIPDDQREAVFASFHRLHENGYQGTGLGLAICRRIVDRHGGDIHVETGPGGIGSTFVFDLPRSAEVREREPEQGARADRAAV
jgi:signal transduction histidine kinase